MAEQRHEVAEQCLAGFGFRIVLEGVSPLVWRRMLIPAGTSIALLHEVLQLAFGWDGERLHRFVVHGREYGIGYAGGIGFSDHPHAVRLSRFGLRAGERFSYEYDFISGWRLQLRVGQVLAAITRPHPDHPPDALGRGSTWRSGRGTPSSRWRSGFRPSPPIPAARPSAVRSWTACAHGSDWIASTGPGPTGRWPGPARGVRHEG